MKKSSKIEDASTSKESTNHSGIKKTAESTETPKTRKSRSSVIKKVKLT